MTRTLICLFLVFAPATFSLARDNEVKKTLERYESFRPSAKDLAIYQIDWAPSLARSVEGATSHVTAGSKRSLPPADHSSSPLSKEKLSSNSG